MKQWFLCLFGVGVLIMGCQMAGSGQATAVATIPALSTLDPTEIALGQQVYATHCASCHGVNLEGEANWKEQNADGSFRAPPHDVTGHTWHHTDDILWEAVTLGGARFADVNVGGTSNMPAFGEVLMDEEMTAVLAYIKSTWPEEIRVRQWEMTVMVQHQE